MTEVVRVCCQDCGYVIPVWRYVHVRINGESKLRVRGFADPFEFDDFVRQLRYPRGTTRYLCATCNGSATDAGTHGAVPDGG